MTLTLQAYDRLGQLVGPIAIPSKIRISEQLSTTTTLTFQVAATSQTFSTLAPLRTIICAFDADISTTEPRFVGPIISRQVSASITAASILTIVCLDPSWILAKRPIGMAAPGFTAGSAANPVGRDVILARILAEIGIDGSANDYASTGISLGSITPPMTSTSVRFAPFSAASDAIQQLGQALGGFDWRIRPQLPTAKTPRLGFFDASPTIGVDNSSTLSLDALGGALNATNPKLSEDASKTTNVVWSLIQNWSQGQPVQSLDQASVDAYGLLVNTITDNAPDALRRSVGQKLVPFGANPRRAAKCTQVPGSKPAWGVDYDIGDTIRHRQWVMDGSLIVDSPMRIVAADTSHQADGTRLVTLTLTLGAWT